MDQVICFETLYDMCNEKGLYIFIAAFILVPICWLRSFKYLAYVSMASNVFLIFACKSNHFRAIFLTNGVFFLIHSVRDHGVLLLKP